MQPNDILRRVRFALDLPDTHMVTLFEMGGRVLEPGAVAALLLPEEDPGFVLCDDDTLLDFLDGLILDERGPPDPSRPPPPRPAQLTNNDVLRKLRIALNLQQVHMLEALEAGGQRVSPGELSALFRKPSNKNYRPCGDQFLRTFLVGMTRLMRPETDDRKA